MITQDKHDLALLIRSGTPLLAVETHEELRAVELFRHVVGEVWRPLYRWTITDGLERLDLDAGGEGRGRASFDSGDGDGNDDTDPETALERIRATGERGIYLLLDFHPYLKEAVHLRLLREIALRHGAGAEHTVALVSPNLELPEDLSKLAKHFQLSLPDADAIQKIVRDEAYEYSRRNNGERVKVSKRSLDRLVRNLQGLTARDARRLARSAIYDDGAITEDDLTSVTEAKFELLGRGGVLGFEYDTADFAGVAGLRKLKQWLDHRRGAFGGETPAGLDPPKGIMLLGVQGCGKSLAAKAVAGKYGVPLLRLDFGALYNKYHGETEKNLRESLETADAMAPCVVWIDEIEKGVSTSDSDGGTSQRVLGTLLTWMAEQQGGVFLVATANDIQSLPPELVRKGRFDEIFFVDLPREDVRGEILRIHLERREQDLSRFDLERLAAAAEGFSGSELEQAVVSALYAAHAGGEPMKTEHVLDEIEGTRPLSVVMAEKIDGLRQWAAERTVPAD